MPSRLQLKLWYSAALLLLFALPSSALAQHPGKDDSEAAPAVPLPAKHTQAIIAGGKSSARSFPQSLPRTKEPAASLADLTGKLAAQPAESAAAAPGGGEAPATQVSATPPRDTANAADTPTRGPTEPQQHSREVLLPASVKPLAFARNFAVDQKDIWTGPFHLRVADLNWALPFTGLLAGSITADAELSSRISPTGSFARHGSTISNVGLGAALAGPGVLYLWGRAEADPHKQESGILAGEAALNSLVVGESLKIIFGRERPGVGSGQGHFFSGNTLGSSFPSLHAAISWSVASVLAREYPGPLTEVLAYGAAGGISLARVYAQKHFPTDVIAGSALGWYIGRQVYARHHDPNLPGAGYGTFLRRDPDEQRAYTESIASPYVPLESWVYAAFDRLESLGFAPSGIQGMKPWTRRECARLLEEASAEVEGASPEAERLYRLLAHEFAIEMAGPEPTYLSLDSVYFRSTSIVGRPLTDGYHFGQTIVNDYGRPYQRGWNNVAGFSSSSSIGPFGVVLRGEYEHAPSAPGVPQAVQNAILLADNKPLGQLASPIPSFNQFRLLDAYAMLNLKDFQFSFGKQSLWLGPTRDPFLMSNNAEPIYMFRMDQASPKKLPSLLSHLGPYRTQFFFGKLTGQHYVATQDVQGIVVSLGRSLQRQPMIHGEKISFKPTPNFEFGVGRTSLFGGPDFPVTLGAFRRSLFSTSNSPSAGQDPGDRRSTFDFTYRLPGMRDWLQLYDDSFVEDEISPIGYPRRAAHNAGLYAPQVPGIPKLDLRVEGGYTNLPDLRQFVVSCGCASGGFFYWNIRYLDGYTNQGNIMGDATLGRQGIGYRGAATYWLAPDRTVQLEYRQMQVDSAFLEGGDLRDIGLRSQWSFAHYTSLTSLLQYEWWNFPLLSQGNRQNNFTASFQFTYTPHWKLIGK